MKRLFFISSKKVGCTILILIFLFSIQGCRYYYKVQTVTKVYPHNIKTCDSLNKFLILHQGESAWHLSNHGITEYMLSGNLALLPGNCQQFRTNHPTQSNRYRRADRILVLSQVHLYLKDSLVEFKTRDSSFTFTGEIFGGAIYSSLERHDYLPSPGFKPEKNRYELTFGEIIPSGNS